MSPVQRNNQTANILVLLVVLGSLCGCSIYREPDVQEQDFREASARQCSALVVFRDGELVFWPFASFRGAERGRYRVRYDLDFAKRQATLRQISVDVLGSIRQGVPHPPPLPPRIDPFVDAMNRIDFRTREHPNAGRVDARQTPRGWIALIREDSTRHEWWIVDDTGQRLASIELGQAGVPPVDGQWWWPDERLVVFSSRDDLYCWNYAAERNTVSKISIHAPDLFELRFWKYRPRKQFESYVNDE